MSPNAGAKAGSLTITGKDAYEGKVSATFEILQKSVSVTGSAANSKAYDGTTAAAVSGSTLDGMIAGTDVSLVATGNFSDKNAGAGKAVLVSYELTGDDAVNYKLASSSESLTADISQKQLTVSGTAPVFDYHSSASGAVTAGSLEGVVSGDTVQIASATATTTDGQMAPGSHDMTVAYTLSGDDAANYTLASETMAGFIRIVVKAGGASEELAAGTYGNAVAGYAGKTGAVGEVASHGTLNLKDGVVFSGSNKNEKGALYNAGETNLTGTVTQNGENDGIYNDKWATLNWDLTGTTKGKLVGYQYLTNADGGYLNITLNAGDAAGSSYEIATGDFSNTTGKNSFWLNDEEEITIGGSDVEYNDKTYRLYVDDNGTKENLDDDKLTLKSVTSNPDVTIDTEEKWFKSGDTITISGTAQSYSTGGLQSMKVTIDGTDYAITYEETIPGSKNYTWSYTYTGADADGTTLTVTATDTSTETDPGTATYNLKVDTAAPTADLMTTAGYDKDGVTWYKQHAEATLSAKVTDATPGSGLDKVTLDGSAYVSETAVTLDTSSERTAAVVKTLVATDVAGNETTKTFAYDVDGTGPVLANSTISGSATYKVSDNSYWVKQGATDVTATMTVGDAKSGVKDGSIKLDGEAYSGGTSVKINVNTSTEVALDAGSHTISAEDNVGNSASTAVKIGVDGTGPVISDPTVTSAHKYETTDGTWVKQNDGATVKATITDEKSGVNGASFNGAVYVSGSAATIDTSAERDLTDQTFAATDHVTNESSKSVKVGVDGSGPEIADPTVAGGNAYKAEEGKYWVKMGETATVAATITDAKSGVDASSVKLDGADYTSGTGASLDTATEADLTDHTFAASDNVTNASTKTIQVGVDGTEPTFTEIDLESANKHVTRAGVWVKKGDETTASTKVSDAKSGVNASTVTFDGETYASGTKATIDTTAESEIRDYTFSAEDNVGNADTTSVAVGVDGTGPDFDITFKSWNKYAVAGETDTYWVQRDSVATATAVVSDAKSGVDASTVTYDGGIYVSGTVVTINTASESDFENYTFAATDNVSNVNTSIVRVGVDGTGPTLVSIVSNPESWATGSVTLTVTYDDGLGSGVKTLEYSEDSETWSVLTGGTYTADENKTVYFRATDNVGSVSEVTRYDIGKIDPNSPSISAFTSAIDLTVGAATVVMTAENEISNVAEYRINGGDWQVYAGPVEHWVDLRAGTADTVFEVKNGAGTVSSYTYTAGSEQELYVNRTYKFYAGEKISYGFLKMMGGDKSDTITFGANSSVHLTGGAVDLSTGSNAIKVEKNADVDFLCETIENVSTLNVAAGVTVVDKKVDAKTDRPVSVTYQGVTYADFSSIAFSADYNASLTTGAYAAVTTGDLSANVKKSNKISVGRNASFAAGDISDFYSISVTAGAKHSYDSEALVDATSSSRLFAKGEQGYTTFSAGDVTTTAKADTLSFGNYTDIDLESVWAGLGADKLSLGSDATLDAKSLDFGGGTDTLTIGAKSTATLGTVKDVERLTVTAGKAATRTAEAVLTTATIESLAGSSEDLAHTFNFGNYTDVKVGSDVTLGTKNDTLSLGNYATSTIDGALSLGEGNDTLKVGSDSTFAAKSLDFGAVDAAKSTDKLTVGARSTATVGDITGVQTITLTAGKAATKTAEEVDTKLSAGAVTMLSAKADTVSIGNYAEVKLASLTTGTAADKVTVGSYDTVDLGDVDLGDGNDTLSIGSYSEVTAKSLDFGDGKSDRLSVGTGSTLTVETLDVDSIGTLTLTSTKGKEAHLCLGADSFAAARERAETDSTWKKYIDNGQIAAIA